MFTYQGHPQFVSEHQSVGKQSKLDLFTVCLVFFYFFEVSVIVFGLLVAYNITAELILLVQMKGQQGEAGVGSDADTGEVKLQSMLRALFLGEESHHYKPTEQKSVPRELNTL